MRNRTIKTGVFYITLTVLLVVCFCPDVTKAIQIEGLDYEGIAAGFILLFAIANWICETVPVSVTALIVIAVVPFTGVMDFAESISQSFGNSIFAFFLGVLILSSAFQQTSLGKIISSLLFKLAGKTPRALIFGIMVTGAFLAMWVTEVAAAAIVFPIALSLAEQAKSREDYSQVGKALMLAVAWGCAFGGVATPVATGANLIALNYLKEYSGIEISFFQWMKIGIPVCVTLLVTGWILLARLIRDNSPLELEKEEISLGKREKCLSLWFFIAVILWIGGSRIGLGSHHAALLVGVALFLPGIGVIQWKDTVNMINWDSIILICAGIVIGNLLFECGVAEWMAKQFFVPELMQRGIFIRSVYIVLSVSVLKVVFSSNTVTGVILAPIMISLADGIGLSAWGVIAPCIFSSALSLVVITSSPVNIIPYSARLFTPKDMLRYGSVMTVASALIIAGWMTVFRVV